MPCDNKGVSTPPEMREFKARLGSGVRCSLSVDMGKLRATRALDKASKVRWAQSPSEADREQAERWTRDIGKLLAGQLDLTLQHSISLGDGLSAVWKLTPHSAQQCLGVTCV
jgi:hypothetical protein